MAQISIIGTGNMGQAINTAFARGGHTVQVIGHQDAGTAVTGEIVVLAVPYPALTEIAAARGDQLAGKIVVDITNPVNFE
ncbi:MAG TPA: NAD(P)-binding domain-containing protein, partial [Gemmatimonadales bacterium]|nr:NAD(P)-binding domain-containing protein [Gemmatimonadales bacterium]